MKQGFIGVIIAVIVMSIALAHTKSQTAVPSSPETLADVRRAIDKGNAQWSEGWAKSDAAMVAAIFANDGVQLLGSGKLLKGPQQIMERQKAAMQPRSASFTSGKTHAGAPETADQLIELNINARGGRRRLKRIKTLTKTGVYKEGNAVVEAREDNKRPNLKRASWKYQDQGGAEGSDGVKPPWEFDGKTAKINTGEAALATLRGAEFDDPFIDYRKKGHAVELIGKERLQGRDAYHLKVTLNDGFVKDYYFDAHTYLLFALRQSMPFHARGPAIESYTYYDDYRPVGGFLIPLHLIQKRASDGVAMFEIQWNKAEANPRLDMRGFSKPKNPTS